MATGEAHVEAARLVQEAGGRLVGRTRLQKVAYLTQLAGYAKVFPFSYRHYGPYSEELAVGMEIARAVGLVQEEEKRAEWGGRYSIYRVTDQTPAAEDQGRARFVTEAAKIGAIELELAATAAFLYADEGIKDDPWEATAQLKPEKAAEGRLESAKRAYHVLRATDTPVPLPDI
jgi:uncharacterized protein YwgA